MNKNNKKFNVLEYDFNTRKITQYDVLPVFIDAWKNKKHNFDKKKAVNKKELSEWIKRVSMYYFWAKCEHEFLMAPWPYNEKTLINELQKIDKHEQIMMNLDIITDILAEEFKIV